MSVLYPFDSRFIDLDGHRFHYIDEGEGPILLMLHGNPTWSFYWRNLIQRYRSNYRVIALDHLGCGYSDKPQKYDYCLKKHIENLTAFVQQLDLKGISLLVHDWGGAIGMGFAVENVERIQRLVIFNSAAFRSRRMPWRIGMCRIPLFGMFAIQGFNGFALGASYFATTKGLTPEERKGYLEPYDTFSNRIAHYRFVLDIPRDEGHPSWDTLVSIENSLSKLKGRPTLFIWGEKDWCFTPAFLDRWLEFFPEAETCSLPEAGHLVVEDGLKDFAPTLDKFLTQASVV